MPKIVVDHHSAEFQRLRPALTEWVRANGLSPDDIVSPSVIEVTKKTITFESYTGEIAGKEPVRSSRTVPLVQPLPAGVV